VLISSHNFFRNTYSSLLSLAGILIAVGPNKLFPDSFHRIKIFKRNLFPNGMENKIGIIL